MFLISDCNSTVRAALLGGERLKTITEDYWKIISDQQWHNNEINWYLQIQKWCSLSTEFLNFHFGIRASSDKG